ncbi:Smr/MutS family protein [Thalassospira marina]|uniref:DNA mismatch repair protein MutS n=1 Tax=Thalassospira marina TaxID=2048283 RepID=A0A2N3KVS7_9PROT|nr:Smr/MutS family protein [Thalassospira marina]AUG54667.1 DNA mismatch repair protein MutS [Thalassospira marina]PKR54675.1 DNA mismatch repair protein MutS [Thalassospira marina]
MTDRKNHRRRRNVTESEKALWDAFTRDVMPLRARRKGLRDEFDNALEEELAMVASQNSSDTAIPPTASLGDEIARSEANRLARNLPSARDANRTPAPKNPGLQDIKTGNTAGIDRSTADRFKKGRMPIEGRIDLHGMTQEVAHHALNAFIEKAWRNDKRCVLVITGKGSRADEYGRTGLLRQRLPQWLSAPRLRPHILAVTQAQIGHGGAGAFYVLLKRRRV